MRVRAPRYERMPMTDCVTSLSMMTDASPMMDASMRERVILAGGSRRALVYSGICSSNRLNAGLGSVSMRLVSKNDRTVPMSFQYPLNGYETTFRSWMARGMMCSGICSSNRLNAGLGSVSMRLVSKNDRTVPMDPKPAFNLFDE